LSARTIYTVSPLNVTSHDSLSIKTNNDMNSGRTTRTVRIRTYVRAPRWVVRASSNHAA